MKKDFEAELVFANFHIGSVMVDFKTGLCALLEIVYLFLCVYKVVLHVCKRFMKEKTFLLNHLKNSKNS